MLLIPGAWVMTVLRCRPSNTSGRLALAVSLSMLVIMVVGCVASVIGPYLGLARPLDPRPEVFIWLSLGVLLLVHATIVNLDPVNSIIEGLRPSHLYLFLASGLLAALSILGVAQLNHSANDHLAIFATCLDVFVLLAGVVGGWNRWSRWPLSTLLYSASLALLLSTSLRGGAPLRMGHPKRVWCSLADYPDRTMDTSGKSGCVPIHALAHRTAGDPGFACEATSLGFLPTFDSCDTGTIAGGCL